MRYYLLFTSLMACTPDIKKAGDSKGVDTEGVPVDSVQDTESGDTGESGDTDAYLPTIAWSAVLSRRGAAFTDILSVGDGSFLLGDPRYARQSGAIWLLDGNTEDIEEAPAYFGSGSGEWLGISISTFSLPEVGEVVASGEYAVDAGYPGRYLAAPKTSMEGSTMADSAVIDMTGPTSGTGYTGGFFGAASAVFDDQLYVSQTNAAPALFVGPLVEGATFDDLTAIEEVDAQPYEDPTVGGYVATQVRATSNGLLACAWGAVCQHLDATGVGDWYLANGEAHEGVAVLDGIDRNTSARVFLSRFYGYYVLSVFGETSEDQYVVVLDDSGIVRTEDAPYVSVTGGVLDNGTRWTAWGLLAYTEDAPDRVGLVYLVAERSDGTPGELVTDLPFEEDYACYPRLVSDEESTLALLCQDGDSVMVGTVE